MCSHFCILCPRPLDAEEASVRGEMGRKRCLQGRPHQQWESRVEQSALQVRFQLDSPMVAVLRHGKSFLSSMIIRCLMPESTLFVV